MLCFQKQCHGDALKMPTNWYFSSKKKVFLLSFLKRKLNHYHLSKSVALNQCNITTIKYCSYYLTTKQKQKLKELKL